MGLLSAIFGGGGKNRNENTVTSNNEINNFTENQIGVGVDISNNIDLSSIAQALRLSSDNSAAALLGSTALNLKSQQNLTNQITGGLRSFGTNALIVGSAVFVAVMVSRS